MKKRFIALFMAFTIMIVLITPRTSEEVWPWWETNRDIVIAEATGSLDGFSTSCS